MAPTEIPIVEIQVDTQAVARNVRAVEAGATDLEGLEPAIILRGPEGSQRVHAVLLRGEICVRAYIRDRTYGVRVYAPADLVEWTS